MKRHLVELLVLSIFMAPVTSMAAGQVNKCDVAKHDVLLMKDAKTRLHCRFSKVANKYMSLVSSYAKRNCGSINGATLLKQVIKENNDQYNLTVDFQGKSKAHSAFCDGFNDFSVRSHLFK